MVLPEATYSWHARYPRGSTRPGRYGGAVSSPGELEHLHNLCVVGLSRFHRIVTACVLLCYVLYVVCACEVILQS